MSVNPQINLSIGKNTVYPGETVTCTWTQPSYDFDNYYLEAFEEQTNGPAVSSAKQTFSLNKTATSCYVTIPATASIGNNIQFILWARKNGGGVGDPDGIYPEIVSSTNVGPINPSPERPVAIATTGAIRGNTISISWSSVTNVTNYLLQRSVDGGAFSDIYIGAATSFTETVQDAWDTLQYRVAAKVNDIYSNWSVSLLQPVLDATSPDEFDFSRLEQLQNRNGVIIYPQTIVEGIFRQSDGKTLCELLVESGGNAAEQGPAGPGVPAGGTKGQTLVKASNEDYDTEWGSGGIGFIEMETSIPAASRTSGTLYGLILSEE